MDDLRVSLLGKFCVAFGEQPLTQFEGHRLQQLLSYLLIFRDRPHPREALATMLWPDVMPGQAKAYLRKTLWQLHTAVENLQPSFNCDLLLVESDWIQVNSQASIRLDVDVLERAFACTQGIPGRLLDDKALQTIYEATDLYYGDLLEGWYQEWCLYERERLQRIYLILLDKLLEHCLYHQKYEDGVHYGVLILRFDQARERTHRHLMRLYYLAGDRTEALRQYQRCAVILDRELGVKPSRRTRQLYEALRVDKLDTPMNFSSILLEERSKIPLMETLDCLRELRMELLITEGRIQQKIEAVQQLLDNQTKSD